jgi:hypothetical protein
VARVYRPAGPGAAPAPDALAEQIELARRELAPLVAGKRHVVPQRWRNAFRR